MSKMLIELKDVCIWFGDRTEMVMEDVNLQIREGEYVAVLGPSGCGKSTLLRLISGLIPVSSGEIRYRGQPITGPNPKAALVFQSSALYPWLTVQQNVELGLKAAGVSSERREERSAQLIRLIGLDGYEDAYPKELSGGMRQRVAFARALAVEPELLCMDEPFSTLDPLTAENLRDEMLDLWLEEQIPLKCILMVTHGIEEAVYMADRIIVLSRRPAKVYADIPIRFRHPRDRRAPEFSAMVDTVYKAIIGAMGKAEPAEERQVTETARKAPYQVLPNASVHMMAGLLELVESHGGREDIYSLGGDLMLEAKHLLPVAEMAEMLEFARVEDGDLVLMPPGAEFVEADPAQRKELFYQRICRLPVFTVVGNVLRAKRNHTMSRQFFTDLLGQHFTDEEAETQLNVVINWGRYAELFHYDAGAEELYLDEGDRGLQLTGTEG